MVSLIMCLKICFNAHLIIFVLSFFLNFFLKAKKKKTNWPDEATEVFFIFA